MEICNEENNREIKTLIPISNVEKFDVIYPTFSSKKLISIFISKYCNFSMDPILINNSKTILINRINREKYNIEKIFRSDCTTLNETRKIFDKYNNFDIVICDYYDQKKLNNISVIRGTLENILKITETNKGSIYNYIDELFSSPELHQLSRFENLLFPIEITEPLFNMIDKFIKKGKYLCDNQINHKMIILIEGPSGSGKTSIINALTDKYNARTFNIKFNNMNNVDQILNDVPLSQEYGHEDKFNIFSIEDVDKYKLCSYDVLHRFVDNNDINNCIFIITTSISNNKLDPNILKGININKIFKLDYLNDTGIENIIKKMYTEISDEDVNMIITKLKGKQITPKVLKTFLTKYLYDENINRMLEEIENINNIIKGVRFDDQKKNALYS